MRTRITRIAIKMAIWRTKLMAAAAPSGKPSALVVANSGDAQEREKTEAECYAHDSRNASSLTPRQGVVV